MTSAPYPDDGDDRAPPARRRGLKIAAAAVAVAVIAGLAGYAYVETTRPRGGEVPLIKAEPGPAKKRPEEPGGMTIPNQDKLVYEAMSDEAGEAKVERLLPPPEEPLPPPSEPEASTPPVTPPVAPPVEPPVTPPAAPPTKAEPAPSPKPVAVAPSKGMRPAPALAVKTYMLQLAAFRSARQADVAWQRIRKANSDVLRGLEPKVERVDLGPGKGVFFRLRAGLLGDEATAKALCTRLKARRIDCLVVRP